jgi:hypothetical protein
MCIPLPPHLCYLGCPSHPPWLNDSNYTWWRAWVMKHLIMQFSTPSCHFTPLQSKYSSQHPVHKHSIWYILSLLISLSLPMAVRGIPRKALPSNSICLSCEKKVAARIKTFYWKNQKNVGTSYTYMF